MVLKSLAAAGPMHAWGIARFIEQSSDGLLSVNYGTIHPVMLRLQQTGDVTSEWGISMKGRKARFYRLTRSGRLRIAAEDHEWKATVDIVARVLRVCPENL
jgi:PadR family transcriptional regulator, regulatory protein PadR